MSTSNPPSATEIEFIEAEAWVELHLNLPLDFQSRHRMSVHRRNGAVLLIADRHINKVIGLGLAAPLTERDLDDVIAEYSTADVQRFIVQWSPAAVPAVASEWLVERGFTMMPRPMTKLYRRAGSANVLSTNPPLTVREIGPDDAQTYEDVVAAPLGVPEGLGPHMRSTIGQPRWRFYLVYDGHRPIAGAALYVRGRMGWCGLGATIESDRRRGAQSALFARRLSDAANDGCEWVAAETLTETADQPNQSYRNMRRLGFVPMYDRPNYLLDLRNAR